MAFYMAGQGVTLDNDGYRFEPVTGERVKLICRGQVTPTSKKLVYEVFVREFHDGPVPVLYADLLVTVDGLKAFYAKRMGLKMVPDWPLTSKTEMIKSHVETKAVAVVDGFPFDYKSLVSCAWGRPSEAFGKFYERFDGTRRVPRLPGPPYHFMTRVVDTQGPMGGMKVGTKVSVEYDVPPDAWYFDENAARVMPYSVLLEVALQPCGWLASFVGSAVEGDTDLAFRNLDGKGRVLNEVHPDMGTITTTSEITNISRAGSMIIESFKVSVMAGDTPIYILTSVFGFFTKDALASQTGLPATPPHKKLIEGSSNFLVDLKKRPARYFQGTAKLADSKLLMIDRVTAFEPNGGKKGLGFARSEKDVTPGEWFLKAHFFQDPVQPGSLGLEAMQQLLMFTMMELGMDRDAPGSRFQAIEAVPGTGPEHVWKYRGQVVLHNKKVNVTSEIIERGHDERGPYVRADASLWVDGKRIYEATNIGMRLVPPGR
jgi:3-hydroxymyristoyl/3-hydroxydecanoyl-(acyl carrier protein) dehydratase